jgi:hypothetical protein
MADILSKEKYTSNGGTLQFDTNSGTSLGRQLIVWITLTRPAEFLDCDKHRFFPAVLDTGYGGSFWIAANQMIRWAKLNPKDLELAQLPYDRLLGHYFPNYVANLWLHVQQPPDLADRSNRKQIFDQAIPIELAHYGVTVTRPDHILNEERAKAYGIQATVPDHLKKRPPLPLLGMRLLKLNKMTLLVDAVTQTFSLSTTRTDWPPSSSP